MQGSEGRPNFEFDFGFLLFWLDDFQLVGEWATWFLLFGFGFDGRRISFFLFDFWRLNFCCFDFLNLMYVIRFFSFWVFVFLV
jgi:hypothetical protein